LFASLHQLRDAVHRESLEEGVLNEFVTEHLVKHLELIDATLSWLVGSKISARPIHRSILWLDSL
jgi:hypothetical protein